MSYSYDPVELAKVACWVAACLNGAAHAGNWRRMERYADWSLQVARALDGRLCDCTGELDRAVGTFRNIGDMNAQIAAAGRR